MFEKKKKLTAGIAAAIMTISVCAMPFAASAAGTTLTVKLTKSQNVAYSQKADGLGGGKLSGSNSATSKHSVRVIAKHQYKGIWYQDCQLLISPGGKAERYTTKFKTAHTWQLGLNPNGPLLTGCEADGELIVE